MMNNINHNQKINANTFPTLKFKSNIITCFISNINSKIVLARQFTNLSKRDLFNLSSLFSRHIVDIKIQKINSDKNNFEVEELNYRLIYQSLNNSDLYIILVTTISHNIFKSFDLLKLLHRTISDLCNLKENLNESEIIYSIKEKAYEIILAFDDIVNPLNGLEQENLNDIKINLKMESSNERLFSIMKKEKEEKARDDMIKGIEEIEKLKRENKYIDNSVSSEVFENKIELNRILNDERKINLGMNLKEKLMQKYIQDKEEEIRRNTYMMACQNIIQNMIVNEMKRHFDGDESDEDGMIGSQFILGPLQIMFDDGSNSDDE